MKIRSAPPPLPATTTDKDDPATLAAMASSDSTAANPNPPRTLQELMMQRDGISFDYTSGDQEYHACLAIMNCVLGYKPTVHQFAKVWKPGFWNFHLMFKNSMNLPFSMLGADPDIQDLFLVVYASSRQSGCDYCTAHSVGLALRNGCLPDRIVCEGSSCERDKSLYTLSKSLSRFPADLCTNEVIDLKRHFSTDKIEWIVLANAATGYLNILAIAAGLSLGGSKSDNQQVYSQQVWLQQQTGWTTGKTTGTTNDQQQQQQHDLHPMDFDDTHQQQEVGDDNPHIPNPQLLSILLKAAKHMPSAVLEETKHTFGVPMTWPKMSKYLIKKVGYGFPLLKNVSHFRITTATYGCVMRDNFLVTNSSVGVITKGLIQLMFGSYYTDQHLQDDAEQLIEAMATYHNLPKPSDEVYDAIYNMTEGIDSTPPITVQECDELLNTLTSVKGIDTKEQAAVLILARSVMHSPTFVQPVVVQQVATPYLTAEQCCEVVHWVGMMVAFHRVLRFHEVKNNTPAELWEVSEPFDMNHHAGNNIQTMDGGTAVEANFHHHQDDVTSVSGGGSFQTTNSRLSISSGIGWHRLKKPKVPSFISKILGSSSHHRRHSKAKAKAKTKTREDYNSSSGASFNSDDDDSESGSSTRSHQTGISSLGMIE